MTAGPVIPLWLTLPVSLILMLSIAVHAAAIRDAPLPPSRKRIRLANALLSIMTLALLTIGFSILDPDRHLRLWTLIWIAAGTLLLMVISMALLDAANTLRLAMRARKALRRSMLLRTTTTSRTNYAHPNSPPLPTETGK